MNSFLHIQCAGAAEKYTPTLLTVRGDLKDGEALSSAKRKPE
jgi:hypothetical protein